VISDQYGQRELEDIVVAGTEKLRPEERRETALFEQHELAAGGM
jgi:hypothetical protein